MKKEENIKTTKNTFSPMTKKTFQIMEKQMDNTVCKIYINDKFKGTAFFCNIPIYSNQKIFKALLTNKHVLDKTNLKIGQSILISIHNDLLYKVIKIDNKRNIIVSEESDITIIQIIPDKDGIYDFFDIYNNINDKKDFLNHNIYILNYAKGKKEITSSIGFLKKISNKNVIYHTCETNEGSSGSPILSVKNSKVIGIHIGRYPKTGKALFKLGIFIQLVIDMVNNKYYSVDNSSEQYNSPVKRIKKDKAEFYFNRTYLNKINKNNNNKMLKINYKLGNKEKVNIKALYKVIVNSENNNKYKIFINQKGLAWYNVPNKREINRKIVNASKEKEKRNFRNSKSIKNISYIHSYKKSIGKSYTLNNINISMHCNDKNRLNINFDNIRAFYFTKARNYSNRNNKLISLISPKKYKEDITNSKFMKDTK